MSRASGSPPLYRQVEQHLVEQIVRGRYSVGDLLPTEAELCEEHGVSRHTVRQALRRIHDLGMIERRTSAGTRVVSAEPVSGYQPVVSSVDDIVAIVAGTRIQAASSGEVTADRSLAKRLRCRVGAKWFCLAGPRFERGGGSLPVCWSEQYLRPDLDPDRLISGRFEAVEMRGQRIEQEITADVLDEARASALEAEPGSPALVVTRRHYDRRRMLSAGVHIHPADRYSIRTVVSSPGRDRGDSRGE